MALSGGLRAPRDMRPGVRSSTSSFNHATTGDRGEILVQPSPDSRLERTRQVDSRPIIIAERGDEGHSDWVGVLDCAVLWACDSFGCVFEDLVSRLSAREGCEENWGGEDDRGDPSVSTGIVMWSYKAPRQFVQPYF